MWLGRCWVCHVGDTATNMTLALWMWNNTWQAELLISNHLLSWYASGNCCTTVFVQHCLYTLGHHNVKCYRLEKNHCCLWCIRPRTVQLSQILHFCAFFNLRAVGAHFKQFLLNTRLQFVRSVAGVHLSSSRISFPWREHISGTCRTSRDGRLLMWYQIILFLIVPRGLCSC